MPATSLEAIRGKMKRGVTIWDTLVRYTSLSVIAWLIVVYHGIIRLLLKKSAPTYAGIHTILHEKYQSCACAEQ